MYTKIFRLIGFFERDIYVGSVNPGVNVVKPKKTKKSEAPAKALCIDDDGL